MYVSALAKGWRKQKELTTGIIAKPAKAEGA
jgi:hypothetical protein